MPNETQTGNFESCEQEGVSHAVADTSKGFHCEGPKLMLDLGNWVCVRDGRRVQDGTCDTPAQPPQSVQVGSCTLNYQNMREGTDGRNYQCGYSVRDGNGMDIPGRRQIYENGRPAYEGTYTSTTLAFVNLEEGGRIPNQVYDAANSYCSANGAMCCEIKASDDRVTIEASRFPGYELRMIGGFDNHEYYSEFSFPNVVESYGKWGAVGINYGYHIPHDAADRTDFSRYWTEERQYASQDLANQYDGQCVRDDWFGDVDCQFEPPESDGQCDPDLSGDPDC